ncbi:hypothetical protein BU14_0224s0003 [Porphyra umbilicalis]|uniref:Uncharacterized protein n=1 Tax=Porphyra umbilicalis TaxID=2786 RepID=A0A1X6P4L9_PORUM|nr:hypothetical protein BU14_0224s0003 [Porphyra umbilicalis]|eukprot:OSX75705.1 hypothetical protein BU14_0224s0003 [Porphyra umbilicalis]
MYLRVLHRVFAIVVALPKALGEGVTPDTGVVAMMKLRQLLTESWRRAIGARISVERDRSATALRLAAALLSPLYAALKPHDPVTKKAGVFNLFLHTTLAHVRPSIGKLTFTVLRFISDDHIEDKIAELNLYFNRRTYNVSRGQSLISKVALIPARFDCTKEALTAERMLFTREMLLCRCVVHVAPFATDDYQAAVKFAVRDAGLSVGVAPSTCSIAPVIAALVAAANAAVVTDEEANAAHVGAAEFASATAASSKATLAEDAPQGITENAATAAVNSSAPLAKEAAAAADVAIVTARAALVRLFGLVPLQFTLRSTPDVVRPYPEPGCERSIEGELQSLLEEAQRCLSVCACGELTAGIASGFAGKAKKAEDKEAAAAAAADNEKDGLAEVTAPAVNMVDATVALVANADCGSVPVPTVRPDDVDEPVVERDETDREKDREQEDEEEGEEEGEEDGGPIGGEGDPEDFGQDMGRPAEQAPYHAEPVEGD